MSAINEASERDSFEVLKYFLSIDSVKDKVIVLNDCDVDFERR